MDPFFLWLESTGFSTWMRESPSMFAFPAVLSVHTIGMGVVAGLSMALDLRVLGVAREIPLLELRRFLPVLWLGFWVNAVSGVGLLIAYPTKALTNPVFYLKLLLIALALTVLKRMSRSLFDEPGGVEASHTGGMKALAIASLFFWIGTITAGRLLAYTYTRLTADFAG
jgi:hypothetical protein